MAFKVKWNSNTQPWFAFQGGPVRGARATVWNTFGPMAVTSSTPSKAVVESPESVSGLQAWRSMIEEEQAADRWG